MGLSTTQKDDVSSRVARRQSRGLPPGSPAFAVYLSVMIACCDDGVDRVRTLQPNWLVSSSE